MYQAVEIEPDGTRRNLRIVELDGEFFETEADALTLMRWYVNKCNVRPEGSARRFELTGPGGEVIRRAVVNPAPLFTKPKIRWS